MMRGVLTALLLAHAIVFMHAATSIPNEGNDPPKTGFNTNGTSIFTNYDNFKANGQAFLLYEASLVLETPYQNVSVATILWISAASFSAAHLPPAVNARSILFPLGSAVKDLNNAGSQVDFLKSYASLYASSYSAQVNAMEQVLTQTTDDWTLRSWDDGLLVNPHIIWEGDDAGDKSANAATSALAGFGTITWLTVEQASLVMNVSVADLTPAKFDVEYSAVWYRSNPPNEPTPSPTPPSSGAGRRDFGVTAFVMTVVMMMAMC